jgi:hypothetical protein
MTSTQRHAGESPAMLDRLQQAVIDNDNVFEVLMDAVRVCSLGQITERPVRSRRAVPAQHVNLQARASAEPVVHAENPC